MLLPMAVAVMRVGEVRVVVGEGGVSVPVTVGIAGGIAGSVPMAVVGVVFVQVFVNQRLMVVGVLVALAQHDDDAGGHGDHGDDVEPAQVIPE